MKTEHSYFYSSPKLWDKLKPLARQMRHKPTPEEEIVWQVLRNRKIQGVKFRRQFSIERFIVDFFALKQKLVIEVDGPIHDYTPLEDFVRQQFLESLGLRVLRFTNDVVNQDIQSVIRKIEIALTSPPPTDPP